MYQGIKTVLSEMHNKRAPSGEHLRVWRGGRERVFTGRNQRQCLPEVIMQPMATDKPDTQ